MSVRVTAKIAITTVWDDKPRVVEVVLEADGPALRLKEEAPIQRSERKTITGPKGERLILEISEMKVYDA